MHAEQFAVDALVVDSERSSVFCALCVITITNRASVLPDPEHPKQDKGLGQTRPRCCAPVRFPCSCMIPLRCG